MFLWSHIFNKKLFAVESVAIFWWLMIGSAGQIQTNLVHPFPAQLSSIIKIDQLVLKPTEELFNNYVSTFFSNLNSDIVGYIFLFSGRMEGLNALKACDILHLPAKLH